MTKLKLRPRDLLMYGDPNLLIFFTGIMAVAWGAFLWLPEAAMFVCQLFKMQRQCHLWDVFDSADTFTIMAETAPQWLWGGSLMFWGTIKLWALFFSKRYSVKLLANAVMCLVWFSVWISVVRGNPASTATITYGFFTLCSGYCMFRRTVQWVGGR